MMTTRSSAAAVKATNAAAAARSAALTRFNARVKLSGEIDPKGKVVEDAVVYMKKDGVQPTVTLKLTGMPYGGRKSLLLVGSKSGKLRRTQKACKLNCPAALQVLTDAIMSVGGQMADERDRYFDHAQHLRDQDEVITLVRRNGRFVCSDPEHVYDITVKHLGVGDINKYKKDVFLMTRQTPDVQPVVIQQLYARHEGSGAAPMPNENPTAFSYYDAVRATIWRWDDDKNLWVGTLPKTRWYRRGEAADNGEIEPDTLLDASADEDLANMLDAWRIEPIKDDFPFFAAYKVTREKGKTSVLTGAIKIEPEPDSTYTVYHTEYPDAYFSAPPPDSPIDFKDWENQVKYLESVEVEEVTNVTATPLSDAEMFQLFIASKEGKEWVAAKKRTAPSHPDVPVPKRPKADSDAERGEDDAAVEIICENQSGKFLVKYAGERQEWVTNPSQRLLNAWHAAEDAEDDAAERAEDAEEDAAAESTAAEDAAAESTAAKHAEEDTAAESTAAKHAEEDAEEGGKPVAAATTLAAMANGPP